MACYIESCQNPTPAPAVRACAQHAPKGLRESDVYDTPGHYRNAWQAAQTAARAGLSYFRFNDMIWVARGSEREGWWGESVGLEDIIVPEPKPAATVRVKWAEHPKEYFTYDLIPIGLQLSVLRSPRSGRWRGLLMNGEDEVIASCMKDTSDEAKETIEGYAKARLEEALQELTGER